MVSLHKALLNPLISRGGGVRCPDRVGLISHVCFGDGAIFQENAPLLIKMKFGAPDVITLQTPGFVG